ncbi:MAG: protein-L-isoaspartate(D-aspartate) O-methyltransferase [Syntrophobacteraceae bacterium]|nr:protein-L-isoaspartate(D-aspartate) O-methyltransferase [Syntrophobacteraceae bacterium]
MIKEIEEDVKATSARIGKTALVPEVMRVMGKVPRHEFVPENQKPYAYENRPLPIGYGQTISQPYIVALMTDLLEAGPGQKVLEVGTGSGYQAAVLSELVGQVYSVEIIPELAEEAAARLKRLGYENVEVRKGDGYYGWEEHAPFDGILVTAAGSHIPPPLVRQLKPGGKMVIPVGGPFMTQQLVVVEKLPDEKIRSKQVLPVAFVPLTGGH